MSENHGTADDDGRGRPAADRYVYGVVVADADPVELPETALDDHTRRLVELVLGGG